MDDYDVALERDPRPVEVECSTPGCLGRALVGERGPIPKYCLACLDVRRAEGRGSNAGRRRRKKVGAAEHFSKRCTELEGYLATAQAEIDVLTAENAELMEELEGERRRARANEVIDEIERSHP